MDEISCWIKEHPVLIFSKTYCYYCKLAKYILTQIHHVPKVHSIDLDVLPNGDELHSVLMEKFCNGIDTVPQIFINGTWIGGCSSMQQAIANGSLWPILGLARQVAQHKYDHHDVLVIGNGIEAVNVALEGVKYGKSIILVGNPWSHFEWGGSLLHTWSIAIPMLAEAAKSVSKKAESNNFALKMLLKESPHKLQEIISLLLSETASTIINTSNANVWKYRIKMMDAFPDDTDTKGKVIWGKATLNTNDDGSVMASIEEIDRKTRVSTNKTIRVTAGRVVALDEPGLNPMTEWKPISVDQFVCKYLEAIKMNSLNHPLLNHNSKTLIFGRNIGAILGLTAIMDALHRTVISVILLGDGETDKFDKDCFQFILSSDLVGRQDTMTEIHVGDYRFNETASTLSSDSCKAIFSSSPHANDILIEKKVDCLINVDADDYDYSLSVGARIEEARSIGRQIIIGQRNDDKVVAVEKDNLHQMFEKHTETYNSINLVDRQYAWFGCNEADTKDMDSDLVNVYESEFDYQDTKCYIKVIGYSWAPETRPFYADLVIGFHLVAPNAETYIQGMQCGTRKRCCSRDVIKALKVSSDDVGFADLVMSALTVADIRNSFNVSAPMGLAEKVQYVLSLEKRDSRETVKNSIKVCTADGCK